MVMSRWAISNTKSFPSSRGNNINRKEESALIYVYRFIGYPAYQQYRQEIKDRITKATEDKELSYYIAVNEAVCNAARYGLAGPLETEIEIKLKIEEDNLQTQITSKSRSFDFITYRQQLRNLAASARTQKVDWRDYLDDETPSGRGIWLMLTACNYLCIEKEGQHILLNTPLPWNPSIVRNQIGQLVSRLFLNDRGLVI